MKPFPGLKWEEVGHGKDAILGTLEDGVRFSYSHRPTCYRRGPHCFLIEVLGGPFHHTWGCFDEADSPARNYHDAVVGFQEMERIAKVLWEDRYKDPRTFICEVLPDTPEEDADEGGKVYRVVAPTPELAQLIAFAADGGFTGTTVELDYDNLITLAKSYTDVNEQ